MARFSALPSDVLAIIFQELSLGDLLSVRQVCKTIHEAISTDKLLWMSIFKCYVIDGGKCVILYRRPLSLLGAAAVESWTRNAYVLEKAYLSTSSLSVYCFKTGIRAVTWVKIIRGRWCLAASSNISESRLTLWDISPPHHQICAEIFLPGPIMDGEIEDLNSEIIIAISMGSRERYVQILTVGTSAGAPHILKLKSIPGADHVLCLRGSYLGVAVLDGDDSNPILLDWKQDTQWILKPSVPTTSLREIFDRTTCLAMTIWDAFVVVAFANGLRVYTYPESHGGHCELLCTHNVPGGTIGLRFVNNESVAMYFPCDVERTRATHLHILFESDGEIYAQSLDAKGQLQGKAVECDVPQPADGGKFPVEMIRMTIGYTGRKFLGLFSSTRHCFPPRLLLHVYDRHNPRLVATRYPAITVYAPITASFRPLTFRFYIFGPALISMILAVFCSLELHEAKYASLGLCTKISYCLVVSWMICRYCKPELLIRTSRFWNVSRTMTFLLTSWIKSPALGSSLVTFSCPHPVGRTIGTILNCWAMSSFRWGPMDPNLPATQFFPESEVNEIRISYGYFGEPYPVAFLQDNHDTVIFRIGSQVFLKLQRDDYWLCCPFALFREPPHELSHLLQTRSVHELNTSHLLFIEYWGTFFNTSDGALLSHVRNFDEVLQHVAMSDDFEMDPNLNNWTHQQWNVAQECIDEATHGHKEEVHPTSDSKAGRNDHYSNYDAYHEENACL